MPFNEGRGLFQAENKFRVSFSEDQISSNFIYLVRIRTFITNLGSLFCEWPVNLVLYFGKSMQYSKAPHFRNHLKETFRVLKMIRPPAYKKLLRLARKIKFLVF